MASLVASSSRSSSSRSALKAAISSPRYASTTTQSTSSTVSPQPPAESVTTPTSSAPSVRAQSIFVSLLLSRQPVITRDPTPLEAAYFHYNHLLQRRLAQPFSKDFYFRKGSAAETRFDEEEAARRKTIDDVASAKSVPELSLDPSATPRRTQADESNDTSSLHRALDRSLFLAFRQKGSAPWKLPRTRVDLDAGETLHKVALRPLEENLGEVSAEKMDAWMVSHLPVGMWPRPDSGKDIKMQEKTYYIRAHLLSGSPDKAAASSEYAWLTSEELAEKLESEQYEAVKDLLSE
ncbi:hypothetical protein BDZ90DRAFT_239133 [Jaminaea rosea]|uniref:Large ribosomal subunit protein mL46 n=1 Tax=Jaminaea rosea TaxID=1569628 RepID=A0A316USC9_9BASI|nr:hypothetical protein BDZ90DRAFT_239133 [Jaminaea rosea]PWN27894.1 hypothetical protein BDZ90DRAFT_239133 [Jaminaea rosea]